VLGFFAYGAYARRVDATGKPLSNWLRVNEIGSFVSVHVLYIMSLSAALLYLSSLMLRCDPLQALAAAPAASSRPKKKDLF